MKALESANIATLTETEARPVAGEVAPPRAQWAVRGVPSPRIRDVTVIPTAPQGRRLTVVKILTDQDGLWGYGCATFTQRADLVAAAVEKYLKPLLIGRETNRIEDIWQTCHNSSYWRNGSVLNSALSGVDMALWDIKGRLAGMPVYELLGGRCREAAACYIHVNGADLAEVIGNARQAMAEGFRHLRLQVAVPGMASYGAPRVAGNVPALHKGAVFDADVQVEATLALLDRARQELGNSVALLHDVHERLSPAQAVQFAKDVERFHLFFLEDPLAPEDLAWLRPLRCQCSTPIAMGELFNNPQEWTPLIAERLIDFIRIHISQAGGLTPCRKIAAFAEIMGVRTAWHGPGDLSPIGEACNAALSVSCHNFGIQEYHPLSEQTREVFSNCLLMKEGYLYPNETPGWGIEVDEKAAARFPHGTLEDPERLQLNGGWGEVRRPDGTVIRQ